jgi:hypothetical protein
MNELLIEKLYKQSLFNTESDGFPDIEMDVKKFALLIVKECANTIKNRAPGQMGKEGEGWTNGYDDGLKTGAFLIKKHFGVEE